MQLVLIAKDVDIAIGLDVIYKNDSLIVIAAVSDNRSSVKCLIDSRAEVNII